MRISERKHLQRGPGVGSVRLAHSDGPDERPETGLIIIVVVVDSKLRLT